MMLCFLFVPTDFFFDGVKLSPKMSSGCASIHFQKCKLPQSGVLHSKGGTRPEHRDVPIVRGDTVVEFTTSDGKTRAGVIYGGLS